MIPDSLYGPLFILAGIALIVLSAVGARRGRQDGAFVRYGKLVFAVLMIGFGVLLMKAARGI
jgi:threonine/homoserine/homoserine lactone efflux protein